MDGQRSLGGVAIATAIGIFGLSSIGVLEERFAAASFALLVAAVIAFYVYRETALAKQAWLQRTGAPLLAAVFVAVALAPVTASLVPGSPVVHGELAEGQHLAVPAELDGRVRVMVHGTIAGNGAASIDYRLEGLEPPIAGRLERVMTSARAGRKRVKQQHDRSTQLTSTQMAPQHELVLARAHGALDGPLEVSVFREHWPQSYELILGALLVFSAAFMSWRAGLSQALLPVAVATVCFGVLTYRWLTPTNALRPEIGALVVAAVCGAIAYLPWRGLSRRWERA